MLNKFLGKRFKPSTVTKIKSYGFAGLGIVAIIVLVMATDGKKKRDRDDPADKVNIVTSSNSRELGLDAVRGISKDAQRKTNKLEEDFEKLRKENELLSRQVKTSTTLARELKETKEELNKVRIEQRNSQETLKKQIQDAVDKAVQEESVKQILNVPRKQAGQLNNDDNPYHDYGNKNSPQDSSKLPVPHRRKTPNGAFSYGGAAEQPDSQNTDSSAVTDSNQYAMNSNDLRSSSLFKVTEPELSLDGKTNIKESPEIYLPKTSILTGVLLTGLDAPTHKGAQESPYPVLVRIKKEAVLANLKTIREVRECFALMSGYGDLSTERAMFRGEGITCVKKDGAVIERSMSGYAAGEDSKAGIKGTLVTRNSTILVNAMMAGFASGMSNAFNVTPTPTYTTNDDGTVNYADVFTPKAGQGALASGASSAMEKLADYYMDLANQMHPVIEIGAGRVIDIILTEGTKLGEPQI